MPARSRARPQVSFNFAISWDGRIATRDGGANFSSAADKRRLVELRAPADAVMVTARTAAADGMSMGLPRADLRAQRVARGQAAYPLRVLVTNSGRIDPELPLFRKRFSPVLIFSTERMPRATQARLATKAELHLTPGKKVLLAEMLASLRQQYGVKRLHCEGGGELFRSLVEAEMVDEVFLTVCPRIFGGGAGSPTLTGSAEAFLPRSTGVELRKMELGEAGECFLRYAVRRAKLST